jgi:hypothetical protein
VASGGVAPYAYTWVWRRDRVNISGATASTYTLTSADAGKNITVRLTATNATATQVDSTTFEAMNFVIGTVNNLPKIGPTLAVRAIRRVPA